MFQEKCVGRKPRRSATQAKDGTLIYATGHEMGQESDVAAG